jgi:protein phosphatase
MGGLLGGHRASELAVETVRRLYFEDARSNIPQDLSLAFKAANESIYNEASSADLEHRMGTTCSALVLTEERGYIGHVGDSRIYRIREGAIEQLTQDHTEVAEMIQHDLIDPNDAEKYPRKSILSRALGIESEVKVDIRDDISVENGDRFVLCTDGLSKASPDEIKDIVLSVTPQKACDTLVELVCEKGGGDNITVLVISVNL